MATLPFVQATEFDFMPDPPDEEIGQQVFVLSDTERASRTAYARVNINGDNEWYVDGDITSVPLLAFQQFTDVGTGPTVIAGPVAIDGETFREFRITTYVATAGNTSRIKVQASLDNVIWDPLEDLATSIGLDLVGTIYSGWTRIVDTYRFPCAAQAVIYDGDGSEDPLIFGLTLHLRR